ncbi:MAG TPA: alpha/beta fold hydrolase [Pseudobdellovibrionaceae bacterium]|nr:alpha/beta fold hydrolase [Pseudobdellovibrionaceae bacterium]
MKSKKIWIPLVVVAAFVGILLKMSVFYTASYEIPAVTLGDDFQVSILKREAALGPTPGTNKTFQWAFPDKRKTPVALVHLHGFSGTRKEIAPIPERIAEAARSNLFMTRLTGHGLGSEAMGKLTAEDLLKDAEEAMAVGRRMGEKTVLIGVSTGAMLALEMAFKHPDQAAGLILISPNFRPSRAASVLLKGPLGKWIARNYVKEHRWNPSSRDEAMYWTTSYPAVALHEMMNLLSWINARNLNAVRAPALLYLSAADKVVSIDLIREKMKSYGGPLQIEELPSADHVLVGDLKGAANNEAFLAKAIPFVQALTSLER